MAGSSRFDDGSASCRTGKAAVAGAVVRIDAAADPVVVRPVVAEALAGAAAGSSTAIDCVGSETSAAVGGKGAAV
jgi:hypothetical protein